MDINDSDDEKGLPARTESPHPETCNVVDMQTVRESARLKATQKGSSVPGSKRKRNSKPTPELSPRNRAFVNSLKEIFATQDPETRVHSMYQKLFEYFDVIPMYNEVLMQRENKRQPINNGFEEILIERVREIASLFEYECTEIFELLRERTKTAAYLNNAYYAFPYNPIEEYLKTQFWMDTENDLQPFGRLAACLHDESRMAGRFLWRWLLGCVGMAFQGEQNAMLIMQGPQGLGKSTFARWLCSGLGGDYFQEGHIDPFNKDHKIRLAQKFIWACDEFGESSSKTRQAALKEFITEHSISERLPYDKEITKVRRRCNLIATSNDEHLFHDSSGSRRYLTLRLTGIDHKYSEISVNDLWGQVVGAYEAGERGILSAEEKAYQGEINEDFHVKSPVENFLRRILIKGSHTDRIPSHDICLRVTDFYMNGNQNSHVQMNYNKEVTSLMMQRLQAGKIKSNGVIFYTGFKYADIVGNNPLQGG